MEQRSPGLTRRALVLGAAAGIGALAGRQCLLPASDSGPLFDTADTPTAPGGVVLNDASELSSTRVESHLSFTKESQTTVVEQLRSAIAEARAAGRPFIASAARHSMGGQSLAKNGTVATFDQEWLEPDAASRAYRVAAGARWSTIIAKLDAIGFSPAVMQSNNDFGVASTYSVNAHGWPVPFSGCGSTVRSLMMVLSDGSAVRCSRTENAELFRYAMGGYGLFGAITELELDMVPNQLLSPTFETMDGRELGARFVQRLKEDSTIRMAYGRMDVAIDRFFDEGLLISYRPSKDQSQIPPAPLRIRSIVAGLDRTTLSQIPDVSVVGERGGGVEIDTPRYDLFTRILVAIARQGGTITEIAGNDDIMVTVTVPPGSDGRVAVGTLLTRMKRSGFPGDRLIVDLKVRDLTSFLNTYHLGDPGLEHVFDY